MSLPSILLYLQRTSWEILNSTVKLTEFLFSRWTTQALGINREHISEEDRLRIRKTIWRFQRGFQAIAEKNPEELANMFGILLGFLQNSGLLLLNFVDLVETLCQEAEHIAGNRKRKGKFKAKLVKGVVIHLLLKKDIDLPRVPSYLEPLVLGIAVDWTIDTIVTLINRHELWEESKEYPPTGQRMVLSLGSNISSFFEFFGVLLMRLSTAVVRAQYPLSKRMQKAASKFEHPLDESLKSGLTLLFWATEHKKEIIAIVEVISIAAQEAESIARMTGVEKKAYVKEAILTFLQHEGWTGNRQGLAFLLTEAFINILIDSVVAIFNKRGLFHHKQKH